MTLSMSVFTQLTRLQFNPATASVHSGAVLQVELTLRCLMPASVRIQQLAASMHFDLERGGINGRSKAGQRQTNPGAVEFQQANSMAAPHLSSAGPSLELDEIQDRSPSDNSLISAGVVCKNTHLVMRRHDSNSPPDSPNNTSPPAVAMMEGALMLKVQDVTLEPGNNSIVFTAPVRAPSLWFSLKQQKYHMTFRKTWESRLSLSLSLSSFLILSHLCFRSVFVEWATGHLYTAPAVRHSGSGAVCAASHLPISPVRSLFSGAPTHCGAAIRYDTDRNMKYFKCYLMYFLVQ